MKRKLVIILGILLVVSLIIGGLIIKSSKHKEKTTELTPIRIGWQTAWIPQAQLAETLKHTDILEKNGLAGDFKGFSYGGPLVEAAVAEQVDVLFVADLPAIVLLSKTDKFSIISRLDDFRNGLIVPASSTVQSIADLKGKVISVPFGSAPQTQTTKFIRENGFDPIKDFQFKNLDILEQSNVIQGGAQDSWGEIDAFATWDPTLAIFENNGKARALKIFTPVGVVLMSNDFIREHEEAAKNFQKSFIEGYYYYAKNQAQADQWLKEETGFQEPQAVIDKMTSLEKNLLAKDVKDIDINIYDQHIKDMKTIAEEAVQDKLISQAPEIYKRINFQLLDNAKKEINESNFDLSGINTK
ncbi:MAG: ABC transporter substrate-binding protein [Patescibacteria group bacterium]|nr:ABC transporter substrate-binding protein [Patescibacteria group bacterium]